MSAGTSASFFLMVCFLVCSSEVQEKIIRHEKITAKRGQDVILPCKFPNNKTIRAVEWIRSEMDPEYVLVYRHGHIDPDYQHPFYQNRVDLHDKEVKDGDASLILKNVKMEDTGIYECSVFEKGKIELITTYLEVHPPGGNVGGHKGGAIAGSVVNEILLLAAISVGFLISRRHLKKN